MGVGGQSSVVELDLLVQVAAVSINPTVLGNRNGALILSALLTAHRELGIKGLRCDAL